MKSKSHNKTNKYKTKLNLQYKLISKSHNECNECNYQIVINVQYVLFFYILFNSSTFTIHKVQLISVTDVERSRQVAALVPVH